MGMTTEVESVNTATETTEVTPTFEDMDNVQMGDFLKHVISEVESLKKRETQLISLLKKAQKVQAKRDKTGGKGKKKRKVDQDPNKPKREPSGFARPTEITDELATFLGHEAGSLMARTDVTREIIAYVKDKELQAEDNKKKIDLNKAGGDKLAKLLGLEGNNEVELTFFNLQTFLKDHFPKSAKKDTKNVETVKEA